MLPTLKSIFGLKTRKPERNRLNHQTYNNGHPVFVSREFPEDPAEVRHVINEIEEEMEFKREQMSKLENTNERELKRKLVDVMFKLQDKDVMKNKELSAKKKGTTRPLLLNKQIIRRVGPADELSKYNRPFVNAQMNAQNELKEQKRNVRTRSNRDVRHFERNNRNDFASGTTDLIFENRQKREDCTGSNKNVVLEDKYNPETFTTKNTVVVLKEKQNQNPSASLKTDVFLENSQNQHTVCNKDVFLEDIHKQQNCSNTKMNVSPENSHYKNENDHNSFKMDAFTEDQQNQKACISSSISEDRQKQMNYFGSETDVFPEKSQSQNTCTKNDVDEFVVDSQTQHVYTQNNLIFAVEDTENHRENSHNHSNCSSTISDVFPENNQNPSDCVSGNTDFVSEENQSILADIKLKPEGIANSTRTRLGSVESLRQIFEKKQESTETKEVSDTQQLATDFKEKLKLAGNDSL